MQKLIRFQCEICDRIYGSREEALKCEERGKEAVPYKPGDIVFIGAGFGWFDGDKRWISNPGVTLRSNPSHGNCFSECCTYRFYYVVTAIEPDTRDPHRVRIYLKTGAMKGGRGGWTRVGTHITPESVKKPPAFVKKDGKRFIGQKQESLI